MRSTLINSIKITFKYLGYDAQTYKMNNKTLRDGRSQICIGEFYAHFHTRAEHVYTENDYSTYLFYLYRNSLLILIQIVHKN